MEILTHIRPCFWILLFLFTSEGFTQIKDTDTAYDSLDAFLMAPTSEGALVLKKELYAWTATSDHEQLAKVVAFCNMGNYEMQIIEFQEAIKSYELARNIYRQYSLSGYDMLNFCYIPLGNLYTKTNAFSEAENLIKEYILLAQRANQTTETVAGLLNLSVVFQSQGNHLQAMSVLKRGLKLAPNDHRLKLNLASSMIQIGDFDASKLIVNQLLAQDPRNIKALQLKAEMQLKNDAPEAAMQSLQLAAHLLEKTNEGTPRAVAKICLALAKTEVNLGVVNPETNYLRKVYRIFLPNFEVDQVLPVSAQLIAENTLIDALDLHALIYTKQGDLSRAFKAYQLAFAVSDMLAENTLLQDTKIMQGGSQKWRSEQSLLLLYELYHTEKDSLWLHEAIQVDQRSKSPVLLKERAFRKRLQQSKDTVLVNQINNTRRALSQLGKQLKQIQNAASLPIEQLERTQQKYNETTVLLRDLQTRLGMDYDEKKGRISLAEIKAVSSTKDETVVSYFMGKESIFQFVFSEGNVEFIKLANSKEACDDLLQRCSKINSFFESSSEIVNDPSEYVNHANALYNALAIPKVKRLVVIPDGILSFLPLNALITDPTSAVNFSEMPFLIRSTALSYALSMQDFLRASKPKPFEGSVLGVFPVFDGTHRALTHSLKEADALAEIVDASLLMREEASVSEFLSKAEGFDVIHISSHARGGSFTTEAGIEFADRTMNVDELYGLQFNKELVVLSACETGVGKIIRGEGVQSMARGFQYTGAQNTLFSLWNVNDFTTASLMKDFYKQLHKMGSSNNALHLSQLEFLDNPTIENSKKSPYYWAAFVYYGDTQKPYDARVKYLWLFVFLTPLLILFFLRKRKSRN